MSFGKCSIHRLFRALVGRIGHSRKCILFKGGFLKMAAVLGVLLSCAPGALSQSDDRNFEVGGQVSIASVPSQTVAVNSGLNIGYDRQSIVGVGGRFGYNFSKHLGLEAEISVFPQDRDLDGGRKVQAVIGLKAGKRFGKIGIFAKVRPGFVHSSRGTYVELNPSSFCGGIYPPPISCYTPASTTNFALDLGGVFEVYPSKRTILRLDFGDTIVSSRAGFSAATQRGINGTDRIVVVPTGAKSSHNFISNLGFGLRF